MKKMLRAAKIMMALFASLLMVVWAVPTQALAGYDDQPRIYLARGGGGGW